MSAPLLPGRFVRAVNPADRTAKLRPSIVLWVADDRALVTFGQSFESGDGPYFELLPKPNGPLAHSTYFYLSEVALLPQSAITPTDHRLARDDYRKVTDFFRERGPRLADRLQPPAGVLAFWQRPTRPEDASDAKAKPDESAPGPQTPGATRS